MNAYMNQYQNNQILNATPERILIMLYDGAIRFCREAMSALEEGRHKDRGEKIGRVMAIVCEFSNTLDHEIGGEIATELDALYNFMLRELTKANVKNDLQALKTVETLLSDLRTTWVEAIEINNKTKNPQVFSGTIAEQRLAVSM